jgi:hypothetical protein
MSKVIVGVIAIAAVGAAWWLITAKPFDYAPISPSTNTSTTPTGRYMDIETYVRQNISQLSPAPEELGGTFYVTKLSAQNGSGTVEYEDGHNAYTADFTYEVSAEGKPTVLSFIVRQ